MEARMFNEKSPLINSDCIIQIENANTDTYLIERLPEDLINLITSFLSYNAALANLRRTCSTMNQIVENTPAGQLAREANDLVQSVHYGIWLRVNADFAKKSLVLFFTSIGTGFGITAGIYMGSQYEMDVIGHAQNGKDASAIIVTALVGASFTALGGGLGNIVGRSLNFAGSIAASRFSLYNKHDRILCNQIKEIRKSLKEPIADFSEVEEIRAKLKL